MSQPSKMKIVPDVKKYLKGDSPIVRYQSKRRRVCWWLLHHGASSAENIKLAAHQKSNGFAKQLVINGTLVQTKSKSGHPRFFYTLTQSGLDFARSFAAEYIEYNKYMSPLKISQNNFDHDFYVQHLSLQAITKYQMEYIPQSQLAIRHTSGAKVPDGLWIDPTQVKFAIEVEFSQKFGRVLDNSIFAIIQSLMQNEYNCYIFFVRSTVIKSNYRDAMKGGRQLCRYVKNDQNRWIKDTGDAMIIPDWLNDRIFFLSADKSLNELPDLEQMFSQ